jgi:CheY-like chemotaxis protein
MTGEKMADKSTTVGVNFVSNVKDLVKDSAQVDKNMKSAASTKFEPKSVSYARQGVAASNTITQGGQQAADSNTARGVGGLTGAAGRDFAAQAQGLGGLVHLYATFAANIFAVSAAFHALKEAMNTKHLLLGIQQLSAQSGKNLTSLAGSLNKVTDGALSLKESLASVATAAAVGMTNKQIIQMGEVAKKASQAMGWDMADAMDRLTKGIGKNRPQLLDELGIIVSANNIYQEYARTIGKTALTLTDYEKKQAFANAVLQQGLDKFGAIEVPTNPFNKLEAASTNAIQSILNVVNTGLGPLVKYLAESPTGLALALTSITGILLKQAIPAMGAFRQNAKRLADETAISAANRAKEAKIAAVSELRANKEHFDALANMEVEESEKRAKRVQLVSKAVSMGKDKTVSKIMDTTPTELQPEQLKYLDNKAATLKGIQPVLSKMYSELASSLRQSIVLEHQAAAAVDAELVALKKKNGYLVNASIIQRIADRESQAFSGRRIAATWAENTQNQGFFKASIQGWKDLWAAKKNSQLEVTNSEGKKQLLDIKGLNTFQVATKGVMGTVMSATAGIGNLLSSLSIWGQALAAIGVAYSLFDSWASKATEQQSNFTSKIIEGQSAIKTSADALDYLATKSKDVLGIVAITAMTNALDGLTTSIDGQIISLQKWQKAAGWWDNTKDWIAGIFGKSNIKILAKNMGEELNASVNTLIFTPKLQESFKTQLAELLQVDSKALNTGEDFSKALSKQLKGLDNTGVNNLLKSINELQKKIAESDATSTAATKSLIDSIKAVGEEVDTITNKLQFKDGIGKLGVLIGDLGNKITIAMDSPIKSFKELESIASNPKLLALLSMSGGPDLIKDISKLEGLRSSLDVQIKNLAAAEADLETTIKRNKDGQVNYGYDRKTGKRVPLKNKEEATAENRVDSSRAGIASTSELITKMSDSVFLPVVKSLKEYSETLIQAALKDAQERASLTMAMASLASAQKAGLITVKEEAAIKLREIDLKEKELLQAYEYSNAVVDNTRALEAATAQAIIDSTSSDTSKESKNRASSTMDILELVKQLRDNPQLKNTGRFADSKDKNAQLALSQNSQYETRDTQIKALKAPLDAERFIIIDTAALKIQHERNRLQQEWVKTNALIVTQDIADLSVQEKLAGGYIEQLASKRVSLEIKQADSAYALEELSIANKRIDLYNKQKNYTLEGFNQKVQELAIESQLAERKHDSTILASKRNKLDSELSSQLSIQKSYSDIILSNMQKQFALATMQMDIETARLNQLKEQDSISNNLYNRRMKEIALAKIDQDYAQKSAENAAALLAAERERARLLTVAQESARAAQEIANSKLGERGTVSTTPDQAAAGAQISAQALSVSDAALARLKDQGTQLNANRETQTKLLDMQYEYLDLLDKQKLIQQDLVGIFGAMGDSMYSFGKTILSVNSSFKELQKAQKTRLAGAQTQEEADWSNAETQKENLSFQIDATTKLAGTSKKLFNEKSTAYKLLDKIEQVAHLASLARTSAQIASSSGLTIANISAGVSRLFAEGGWAGFVGAAAFLALMASLGHSTSSNVPIGGFTAEEQQKVQGTGQSYDASGNIQNRSGGALGDPTAKLTSINDSISILKGHSFETLEFSNKMLKAMEGVKTNTDVLSAVLQQTGVNIAGKNPDGTDINTTSSTNYNSLTNPIGTLVTAQSIIASALDLVGLGGGKITDLMNSISNSIFGGKTKTTLEDTGLLIKGTLDDISSGASGLASMYTNIKTVVDGGWFKSDKTKYTQSLEAVDDSVQRAITGVFTNIKDSVLAASEVLGKNNNITQSIVDSFVVDFKTSFKDLKPEEITAALEGEISNVFNSLAEKIAPELMVFRQSGEEMGTTLIRLSRDIQLVNLALTSVGMTTINLANIFDKVNITEKLIELSGGIDNFLSQSSFFKDNFLTEAQRLAPVQSAVTAEMQRLGLSSIVTREQFANVVTMLDLTSIGGQQLYTDLMNVAAGFAEVHPETRVIISELEKLKSKTQQQIDIYTLEGRLLEALNATRTEELAQMDDSLKAGQLYIYALQDEATLKGKLKTAYDKEKAALDGTISSLTSSIKTLRDFRTSLVGGAQSNLTPTQKYQEAKTQAEQVAAIASGIANTDAEKQAKTDAINKLPTVSSAFLDASRMIFASSDAYNKDFSYIQNLIDSTTSNLELQKTDAEIQLEKLDTQISTLLSISDGIETTNSLLSQLAIASANTTLAQGAAAQSGYIVSGALLPDTVQTNLTLDLFGKLLTDTINGLSIVWNDGIKTILPVTNGNLSTSDIALLAEVASLTAEVAALRNDQQKQTADIITTNYDATTKAANDTALSFENLLNDREWEVRNLIGIA